MSVLGMASQSSADQTLFGPKQYTRVQGKPSSWSTTFSACPTASSAVLKVINGSGTKKRVSSAVVSLNGVKVVVERDLSKNVSSLARAVNLKAGLNTISVTIKSGAGDDDYDDDSDDDDHEHGDSDGDDHDDEDHEENTSAVFLTLQISGKACGSSDTTPPVISNPQPAAGVLLAVARPVISASYTDNSGGSGIDTASVRVTLDGGSMTPACSVTAAAVSCALTSDLVDGVHSATASLFDLAKNPATYSWRFTTDTVAQKVTMTSPQNGQNLGNPLVTVTGTVDDPAATITVNGKAATLTGLTFSATDVSLTEGANTLTIIAVDQAGNQSTASVAVTLDTALPVVTITAPVDGSFTNVPTVTVSGSVSEAPATVTINGRVAKLTGQTFVLENLPLAEGQNSISAEARDLAGNKGSAVTTVTLDTVNPQIFASTPADGLLTRNPQLTISGAVSEPLTTLLVNGQPVTLDALSFSVALTLAEGANSILLIATDRAGNKGTITLNVTLDSTPPIVPVLEALTSPTNNQVVTVKGSAEPGSSVALSTGGVQLTSTTADSAGLFSFAGLNLTEGETLFTVQATDSAGNVGQPSAPQAVTLDTKAPAVSIVAPLDKAILNTPIITVSGTIDDPTAQVAINGLPALNSAGTWTLEGFTLQEGSNSLLVEARDAAGNKGSAGATVVLDTIPPTVTITAPVDGLYTNIVQVTVTGTVNEEVASVTINGVAASVSTTSPLISTFTGTFTLTEGGNAIVVVAVDKAGNKGTANVSVTLDTIAPQLTVIGPTDGALLNNGQITFGGSAAEPVVSVLVNGASAPLTAGTGGYTLPLTLAEGNNTLTVTAIDRAGNSSTSTISVDLDSIAPAAPLLDSPATPTRTATTTVSGQAEANSSVKLFNNSQLIATLKADATGLFTVPNITLTEGNNPFSATATDAAENVSPISAPLTVVLDTKAPMITVTAPQPGVMVSAAQVTITGTVDEPLASLTVNGASTPLNSLAFEYVMTLAAGDNSALIMATDLAGNVATTTITIQRDNTPPRVVITAPLNGLLTNTPQIQVSGTVDDAEATLTVAGAPVTSTPLSAGSFRGEAFSVGYLLSDGENSIQVKAVDKAGNEGVATVLVTLDAQPPVVTLAAPATATAGTDVQITVNATDNRGLTLVDLSADGASLWSASPTGATAGQSVSLRLSPTLTSGATVTVRGRALDAAGNSGSATAVITIDKAADGPGWLQGKVLDDSRGLALEGVQVSVTDAKGQQQSITTTADGAWFFELASGPAKVEVVKGGFTTVRRDVTVRPGQRTSVLDSRLTRIDGTVRLVDVTGGNAGGALAAARSVDIIIPANALSTQADVRLTPISNQGMITPLPLGWSPLAVVELRLLDPVTAAPIDPQPLTAAAVLTLPLPKGLGDAALTAQLARYDNSSRSWLVESEVAIAAKATTASAPVNQPGQYAFVLADPAPNAPPIALAGQELPTATLTASDFSLITTTGRVVPQAAPPSVGLCAAGDLLLVAKADAATAPALISGLVVNARVTEKFDLISGDKLQPASSVQDIVLYRTPCATAIAGGTTDGPFDSAQGPVVRSVSGAELRTTFPVSPSRDFTIVDLLLGKISIDITQPDSSGGIIVGADGARLLQPDGTALSIPAGALTGTAPVSVATLPDASLSTLVGADFRLLRGVDVTIGGQTLRSSATLSIPSPAGFDPALPVVVAKKFDVKGGSKLKLVAMGRLSGSIINSEPLTPELSNSTNSINSSGQYLFLQAVAPIGYVTGQITDSTAAPFAGIQVSAQSATLADLTGVSGQYLLALAAGAQTVTALDPTRGDAASGNVTITANNRNTLNLTVRMVPPTVLSITPANGATNVQPTVPVVVTFSKQMDKTTINSQTLKLTNSSNSETVPGVLTFSVDNTAVSFYPSEAFKQETTYTVTIAATVKDLQGYPLGQNVVSNFTIRRTTSPVMPVAGAVSGTFPDADGYISVTATQGSAEFGSTVLLINDTTGEIQSVTPLSNGSFTGRVRGQLGDEIKVVLMDYSGNQTLVSYLTFKSDDGKYMVTAKGGKVEGEGGSALDIPEGALAGPTILKITQVLETALPPVPEEGKYLAAFNIDTGAIPFQKEVHLSIPVPNGFDPDIPVFVAKPREQVNADGTIEKVYEIIDSTKIVGGRITTASPPFDGVWGFGIFSFISFSSSSYQNQMTSYRAVVSGTTYRDMDGDNTYSSGDLPVTGAVVRAPGSGFVAYSKANGSYATTVSMVSDTSVLCKKFQATATHPVTMYSKTMPSTVCQSPYNIKQLNFKLADKDSSIPDKTPPLININLQVAPGQPPEAKFTAGTVPVGTDILIPLTIIDQEMGIVTLTIQSPGAEFPQPVQLNQESYGIQTPMSGDKPAILRYAYTPLFTDPIKGSTTAYFRPGQTGVYTIVVEAKDTAGNKSRTQKQIRAVNPGTTPGGIDGAPTVDMVSPAPDATDIMVTTPVTVYFSEPVDNVTETTFKLIDTVTGNQVPATVTSGIENGRMTALLTPKGNLFYDRKYQITLTQGITDSNTNPSSNNTVLPLKTAYLSTFKTKTPKAYDLSTDQQFTGGWDIALYNDQENNRTFTYITGMDMGWKTVEVTDPTNPAVTYTQAPINQVNFRYAAVEPQQKMLGITESLLGSKYGYVRFYDLAESPQAPKKVGQEKLAEEYSGVPSRLAISGKYAYVATVMTGLQVVDIDIAKENVTTGRMSSGAAIVGVLDTQGDNNNQPWDIALYGASKGLLTTSKGDLLTLDLSTPQAPQIMNSFHPTGYAASRVAVAAEYPYIDSDSNNRTMDLAVTGGNGKINTVDVSDPTNPVVIGTAKNEQGQDVITFANEITLNKDAGLAFVTTYGSVQIFDIKDPNNPKLLNSITQLPDENGVMTPIGNIPAIVEKGGWVYLASQVKGFRTLDLDPAIISVTAPPIKIDKPIKGFAVDDNIPITYTVREFGDFSPFSANMYIYENDKTNEKDKIIARFLNINAKGTNTIMFPAKFMGIEFDVSKRYEVEVAFNESTLFGLLNVPSKKRVRIPLEWQAIATDFNRDGKIDATDLFVAGNSAKPYYFWINDNDDIDDVSGNGIPGSGPDWKKGNVSGLRDLIDYIPVHLDIAELLAVLPAQNYGYVLKQEDSAVSIVLTNLKAETSKMYLTDVPTAQQIGGANSLGGKKKFPVTRGGLSSRTSISLLGQLDEIKNNKSALLLVDGRAKTEKPLVLEVWDRNSNDVAFRTEMKLSLDGVEQMFRHKNLMKEMYKIENPPPGYVPPNSGAIPIAGHSVPDKGMSDRLTESDFSNSKHFSGFDAQSSDENFIFVHGLNVNGEVAREAQSEIFKRLYWSGSRAKFWGITWYGWESQINTVVAGTRSLNYAANVRHAFNAGKLLNNFVWNQGISNLTIAGHSLGNMVVSTAIQKGIPYKNYLMINAAVAEEAYTPKSYYETEFGWTANTKVPMYHPRWRYPHEIENETGFKPYLWASEWYTQFNDDRSKLTWRNYFGKVRDDQKAYVFFTPTDEAFRPFNYVPKPPSQQSQDKYIPNITDVPGIEDMIINWGFFDTAKWGTYAWSYQELTKGRMWGQTGGWGFNVGEHDICSEPTALGEVTSCNFITPFDANTLDNSIIKTQPLFTKNQNFGFMYSNGSVTLTEARIEEQLAYQIPALTFAAGHGGVKVFANEKNINIQDKYLVKQPNASWPREPKGDLEWRHNDLYYMAYPYVRLMFDDWIKIMTGVNL